MGLDARPGPRSPFLHFPDGNATLARLLVGRLIPRADVSFIGEQFFDAGNSVEIAQTDDVTLVNASLTLASADDEWRLMLSGFNLTDELYPVAGTSSMTTASGYAEIIYARPRNFTFNATRSF